MIETDINKYLGKLVVIRYGRENSEMHSEQGEVLTVEKGMICLGVNVTDLSLCKAVKLISIADVWSIEENLELGSSKDGFLTVGNYFRYCTHLLRGIELKSKSRNSDFYGASDQYLMAMKAGFINDEIVALYLETIATYLGNFRMDRTLSDDAVYDKELKDRIECLRKFRNFFGSENQAFDNLSDHILNKILSKIFIQKSYAYSANVVKTIYRRYSKESLISDVEGLLNLPKIVGNLLLFAVQTEAMYYLAKAYACADYTNRKALFNKKKRLDDLVAECKDKCKKYLDNLQSQADVNSPLYAETLGKCEKLAEFIQKTIEYKEKVGKIKEELEVVYSVNRTPKDAQIDKPLLFSFIFERMNKVLNDTENILSKREVNSEKVSIGTIKNRYDLSMAQFYNLYEHLPLFEKDYEGEEESKWQIALQLMDIYSRKLRLVPNPDGQEYVETKSKYRDAIDGCILEKLRISPHNNYYYGCKRSKLSAMSTLLYEFELTGDYLLISDVLLDDKANIGKENKTPLAHKMLCKFRRAKIFLGQSKMDLFSKEFTEAKLMYDVVSQDSDGSNKKLQGIMDEGLTLYWDLYPSFDENRKKLFESRRELVNLLRTTEIHKFDSSKMSEYKSRFIHIMGEIIDGGLLYSEQDDYNDVTLEVFSLINKLLPYFGGEDNEVVPKLVNAKIAIDDIRIINANRKKYEEDRENFRSEVLSDLKTGLIWALQEYQESKGKSKSKEAQKDFISRMDKTKWFSKKDRAEMVLEVVNQVADQYSIETVARLIQYDMQWLIDKAKKIDILTEQGFHYILQDYCYYFDYESVDPASFMKACLCMAKNPCPDYSIDKRKEFCQYGLNMADEIEEYREKYADTPYFKDEVKELNDILDELNSLPVTRLDELRESHDCQATVNFLYEQFTKEDKLKYLTHASGKAESRRYSEQLQGMRIAFDEDIKKCKSKGVGIPVMVEEGIRSFINGSMLLDGYMYKDDDERQPVGWGAPLWIEWLNNHSSVRNPQNDGIDFPYLCDLNRFRSMFRIENNQQLSEMIAAVAPGVTQIIGKGSRKYHYYGWMPQVAEAVKLIVADICKISKDAEIVADIDLKNGTLTIIHKDSDPTERAESFYAKLSEGGGAIFEIAKACLGVCDYHVVANWEDGKHLKKVNILNNHPSAIEDINEKLSPAGFRHVLTFYKPSDNNKKNHSKKC